MHLAILGTDSDVLALAAAAKSLGHTIAWLGDVRPADAEATAALIPSLNSSDAWETLLDQATADAVIIGRGTAGEELRAEQLKRLATDAVPLLVVHPICNSVLTYYELDMIRRETRAILRHYNPLVGQPAITEVAGWIRGGHPTVGAIHQVSCERQMVDDQRESVLEGLARDTEMLAAVAGSIRKVSAVGPQSTDASFASLQVQMMTAGAATVRWSLVPQSVRDQHVDLTLVGQSGLIVLHITKSTSRTDATAWTLEEVSGGQRQLSAFPPYNAPDVAIEQLAMAVSETATERRAAASTWDKATQSMEVVEAIELSLQKGRTMEVHQQQLTEQLAFRGTMAALGCGLLLVGFAVLVFASLLGGVETILRQPLVPSWPLILLAVLAFFLLLQAVPLLVSKKNRRAKTSSETAESDTA